MVYTVKEYAREFKFCNKYVSTRTIIRRCKAGMLPENHFARKIGSAKGVWTIEVRN